MTSVIEVVVVYTEVAVIVTGGITEVVVVVNVEPLSVMITSEVIVEPGNVVTEPGSCVVTVTAGCVVVMTAVVV